MIAALLGAAVLLAGCGSSEPTPVESKTAAGKGGLIKDSDSGTQVLRDEDGNK